MGKNQVVDREGNILIEILRLPFEAVKHFNFNPLTSCLLVVKYKNEYLLVFNRFRNCWEVPGGGIEPGETLEACAARELNEESGQLANSLKFEGIFKVSLIPNNRIEYGALFSTNLTQLAPFSENEEIIKITLWDLKLDIGYVNEIDEALLKAVS